MKPASLLTFAPNDVIWKHELYFLVLERKCFASSESPFINSFNDSGGSSSGSNFTFLLLQHIPGVSPFHFNAPQNVHTWFILPIISNWCSAYWRLRTYLNPAFSTWFQPLFLEAAVLICLSRNRCWFRIRVSDERKASVRARCSFKRSLLCIDVSFATEAALLSRSSFKRLQWLLLTVSGDRLLDGGWMPPTHYIRMRHR